MNQTAVALLCIAGAAAHAQNLSVTGDIPSPLTLTAADLANMPRQTVTIPEQDGTKVEYEGVALREILKRAGAPGGRDLRGRALASYIVAKAHDGYQVVFTLGEIDPEFGNETILVADKRAGKALFEYQGPFRLICPGDKAGARSVRMLETLEVVELKPVEAPVRKASLEPWKWDLPKGFPEPRIPAENPMTRAKVELGGYLFYDRRLSVNGAQSCASCHKQELAFTDGRAVGVGATGEHHQRGPMSLVNVAYSETLTWNNPDLKALEEQALTPMFGTQPVELGLTREAGVPAGLRNDPKYAGLFAAAFPAESNPVTIANITRAIACFERSIISARSPYDRYHYGGDDSAVSAEAKHGEVIFFSQPYTCFRCHGGFDFSNSGMHDTDVGSGKFKAPTLRNIALTAPYMHDGSMATLDDVIARHSEGNRMSPHDRKDVIAFLETLTDREVISDPRFSNPW